MPGFKTQHPFHSHCYPLFKPTAQWQTCGSLWKIALQAHHASVADRLSYIEQLVGDSFDRHSKEIQSSHSRLESLHNRLAACESQANQNSLRERVDFLEQLLGESSQKHAEGLQAAHSNWERIHGSFQEQISSRMEKLHGSIQERLELLEKQFAQADERRTKDWEARLTSMDQQISESVAVHGRKLEQVQNHVDQAHQKLAHHQSSLQEHRELAERVHGLEALRSHSEQAHSRLDQLHGRMVTLEAQGGTIESLKQNHAVWANEKAKRDAHHASMAERLDYIEKLLGDSADRHSQELKVAHQKLEQMHGRLSACERSAWLTSMLLSTLIMQRRSNKYDDDGDRGALVAEEMGASGDPSFVQWLLASSAVLVKGERVDYLESAIGDSADKHARELESLKTAHSRLQTEANHVNVGERLSFLEKAIGDSAERHSQELAAAHSKLASMHARLSACEATGSTVDGLKKAHASLVADKTARDAHHASFAERLDYLERTFGDSADMHAKQLKAAHDKIEKIHARVASCEDTGSVVADLHKSHHQVSQEHRDKLSTLHSSVSERLSYLEGLMGESADMHARELEALKTSHSRMASEAKARDAHHTTVSERLDFIEKLLGDSADKHAQEIKAAHSKIDQVHQRVAGAQHEDTLRTLLHSEKEARQKHVATLEERLGRLETAMGDTHSKHSLEIEATKAAHQRLSKEQKLRDDKHASIAERLEYLEAKIGDSFDQHERELKAAHSKLEQVHTRLSQCEKHGANISELHRSHSTSSQEHKAALAAHSASLGERLDFLEKSLGQSAEKHAKEVDALKASHSRITTETKLRDAHHATVSERLEYIEKMIGDSADKHAKELSAAHEKIQDMHKRVADCEARGSHVEAVRKAHDKMANDQAAHASNHATLRERVDFLEKKVGDSAEHHKKELQATRQFQEQLHSRLNEERQLREQAHEQLQGEKAALNGHRDVDEVLQKERGQREQAHAMLHDLVHKEKAARTAIEEVLAQEKGERTKHLAHLDEKVDSLQKSMSIFDSLVRKAREILARQCNSVLDQEIEERTKEYRRLWDAIVGSLDSNIYPRYMATGAVGAVSSVWNSLSSCDWCGSVGFSGANASCCGKLGYQGALAPKRQLKDPDDAVDANEPERKQKKQKEDVAAKSNKVKSQLDKDPEVKGLDYVYFARCSDISDNMASTPGKRGDHKLDMSALVTLQGAELPKAGLYVSLHSLTCSV
ncbi:unnamed protein product [Symbiodinium pilosum]|uniref:Uncharacterized protein n=1 Tax=Symbiodinium pilosum TaxID=2952 RepID=A0A812VQD6_SYMPI|nr:unnamed protein product [Symbiodinium pilosum]